MSDPTREINAVLDFITGSTGGANRRLPTQAEAAEAAHRVKAALSTTPAPLDEQRLARALCASRPPVVEAGDVFVDDECRSLARRVAREYAALEGATHE